jgi:D-sedoheptulose 7-phosphate isomerase
MNYSEQIHTYFSRVKDTLDALSVESLNNLMNLLEKARDESKFVYIMGNGGSAATASHYVCDFNKGLISEGRKGYKFLCLNDNFPSMMAWANDISYDEIFVGQLKSFLNIGDIVIGISGSGNSMNVLKAIKYANENGGITVGLTGYDGGKLKKIAKYNVHVPIDDMQITEDLHMVLDHCMMKILCDVKSNL